LRHRDHALAKNIILIGSFFKIFKIKGVCDQFGQSAIV